MRISAATLLSVLSAASVLVPAGAEELKTFTITEAFGVSHRDQIIDFDLDIDLDPVEVHMLGPDGKPVVWQLIDHGHKLAVRTDLPAGSQKRWRLMRGGPAQQPEGEQIVRVKDDDAVIEITNGLTGVRVPVLTGVEDAAPPPVLALRTRSGVWLPAGSFEAPRMKSIHTKFLERGPLVTKVAVEYTFETPEDNADEAEAGEFYYTSTIELQAGQPVVMFEEESNTEVSYEISLNAIQPTQGRYRGQLSTSVEKGREADGRQYRRMSIRPPMDALINLNFDEPTLHPKIYAWNPWCGDTGWYWQIYNEQAPADADLAGVFTGRASRAWCPAGGVRLRTAPPATAEDKSNTLTLRSFCVQDRRSQPEDARFTRFQWGFFAGKKSDLASPQENQPIQHVANIHQGIDLNKIHRLELDFPDPPQGYGAMYMPREALKDVIEKIRADTGGRHGKGFYGNLMHADPPSGDLFTMWKDTTGEKIAIVADYTEGDGIHEFHYHYWMGGMNMNRKLVWIDQVLASDQTTREQKAAAKAAAVLFASILWDNDFVPLNNHYGINLGTPNMPVSQWSYRNMFALFLSQHPMMKERLNIPVARTAKILENDIHDSGAHMASVCYIGAGMGPTLAVIQQLQMAGIHDFFADEPLLAKFAEFYLQCTTPPEPRFGGSRKNIPIGDGSTVSSVMSGQLATGFALTDPELSARLMGIWRAQGKTHSSFNGATILKIDERLPDAPAELASTYFEGYFSVMRAAFDTPAESVIWFVNGEHYVDHSHYDQGGVTGYLLGSPFSVDWGSFYSPRVAGAMYHSLALPESYLGHPWDKHNLPLDAGRWSGWAGVKARHEVFKRTTEGGWSRAAMTAPDGSFTWTRAVGLVQPSQDVAVLAIQDSYNGAQAEGAKIFTLNLMAEGSVETPAGNMTPVERIYGFGNVQSDKQELASAGTVFDLKEGVNRLGFTGQAWKAHPAQGIDFDIFVVADVDQQAHIGNWAHVWHPNPEMNQFRQFYGRPFEERQHILRIRSLTGFRVVVVVWQKGKKPQDVSVQADGADIIVTADGNRMRIKPEGAIEIH